MRDSNNRKLGRFQIAMTCLALVASLGMSAYGWRAFDKNRKTAIELDEMEIDSQDQPITR